MITENPTSGGTPSMPPELTKLAEQDAGKGVSAEEPDYG
jgi:hypothetical protein